MLRKFSNIWLIGLIVFTAAAMLVYVRSMPSLNLRFLPWQTLLFLGYASLPTFCLILFSNNTVVFLSKVALSFFLAVYPLCMIVQLAAFSFLGQPVNLDFLWTNWAGIEVAIPWYTLPLLLAFLAITFVATYRSVLFAPWFFGAARFRIGAPAILVSTAALSVLAVPQKLERVPWDPVLSLLGVGSTINYEQNSLAINEAEKTARKEWVPSQHGTDRQNIIMFMADSVNVDHMSVFGYGRETSPFLSNLGEYYPNVSLQTGRSSCADSICGIMSTLLSRRFLDVPTQNFFGLGSVLSELGYDVKFVLASDHRKHTYETYLRMMQHESDTIYDFTSTDTPLNSDRIALEGLQDLPAYDGKPVFVFVFFFSAHIGGETLAEFAKFGDFLKDRSLWIRKNGPFSAQDISTISNHYDNKLAQLDHFAFESWKLLRDKGYTQNSSFFFLADHGEELGTRSKIGHSIFGEGALRIPFIAASTNPETPLRWTHPEQIDLAPTILAMLGENPPSTWRGVNLLERTDKSLSYHETGILKFHKGENCIGLFQPNWKGPLSLRVEACLRLSGATDFTVTKVTPDHREDVMDWNDLDSAEQTRLLGLLEKGFPRSKVLSSKD